MSVLEEHWQSVLADYQATRRLPSVVAGVLQGGELRWTGSAGAPSGPDVQYRIGSITKTMTAVLVMQARDEGLLGLDDPIGRFIPESAYAGATVRQLLSHTGGLQSEPAGPWWERSTGGTFDALVAANDGSGRVFGPAEAFHYSNLGFALLGEAVARLRDEPWEELVADRVWRPLRLDRTSCLPTAPATQGYSVDHLRGTLFEEPATDTGAMAPAGQVWSTVGDLATFAGFLATGHPDVLPASTLEEMRTPVASGSTYGLGMVTLPGTGFAGHLGSMPGFQACLYVDATSGEGLVALCNGTTGFAGSELALRMFNPGTPVPVRPWVPTTSVPDWAEELVGWWFWGNSAYEMRFENAVLQLRDLARGYTLAERFDTVTDPDGTVRIVGVDGYHLGETLQVRRRPDGSVGHLECATFVYTRVPYDPQAPIPGPV